MDLEYSLYLHKPYKDGDKTEGVYHLMEKVYLEKNIPYLCADVEYILIKTCKFEFIR